MKLPIGISDFKKLRRADCHYVDKSLAIAEVLDSGRETILITRPRRFGKTINLSMMRYFFEATPEERTELFGDLAIAQTPHMQRPKSPVIFLTLKDLKHASYERFLEEIQLRMSDLYLQFEYLYDHISHFKQPDFKQIAERSASEVLLQHALFQLTQWLHQYHGEPVMVFIDEYDTPIHEAWTHGYYPQVIDFMRTFLGKALKDNLHLDRAVLTGILRVAKESIFSDLNNLAVCSLLDHSFADKFGFTEAEVEDLLDTVNLSHALPIVREWYNGYRMGDVVIYNPWSVIYFAADNARDPKPYWINTSANNLIKEQLMKAGSEIQSRVEYLLQGGAIKVWVRHHTSFTDISNEEDALWTLLLFSGYLKVEERSDNPKDPFSMLTIPNKEVTLYYQTIFQAWFQTTIGKNKIQDLTQGLITGQMDRVQHALNALITGTLSYHDIADPEPERIYHVFVLGLLAHLDERYIIRSNRESGYGRYDCLMIPRQGTSTPGVILEFKTFQGDDPDEALRAALAQIQSRDYAADLRHAGIKTWIEVAIAFNGKRAYIKSKSVD